MNTNHTNFVHRSVNIAPRPEGKICTAQGSTANKYPAPDESKRELHKPCGGGSSAPPIKADKVCSRQPVQIRRATQGAIILVTYRRHTAPKTATFLRPRNHRDKHRRRSVIVNSEARTRTTDGQNLNEARQSQTSWMP